MRVVTLGDLLLDVVVRLEAPPASDDDVPAAIALVPGGQAANVAAWVAWLGAEARLVARRTDDAGGSLIAGELGAPRRRAGRAAGRGRAHGHRGRARRARRHAHARERPRRSRGLWGPDDVDASWRQEPMSLHVAGYTLLRAPGAEAALRLADAARRYGARVTVDLSTAHGIAELGDAMRSRVAALAPDVVFANEAEAEAFGAPMGDAWVVKRGARGCTVLSGASVVEHAGRRGRRRDRHDRRRRRVRGGFLLERAADAAQRAQAAAARCMTPRGALP